MELYILFRYIKDNIEFCYEILIHWVNNKKIDKMYKLLLTF